jgi:hypothetical protein
MPLLFDISAMHADCVLFGSRPNELLELPEEQLAYLVSLLRGETPEFPELSLPQWYALLRMLEWNMFLPYVYKCISQRASGSRPPVEVYEIMKGRYLQSMVKSMASERQLKELLSAFGRENIRVIVIKGQAAAWSLYPDPAMRPVTDIDILVRPGDVHRSGVVLEKLGYRCLKKKYRISIERYHEEKFERDKAKDCMVEIQWNIFPFYAINELADTEPLFARAVKVKMNGISFDTLHPVDALIFSSNHMVYGHSTVGIRLSWIIDTALMCNRLQPDDWITLEKRCIDYLARSSVEKSLKMAECWSNLQIPGDFCDFSKWPEPSDKERLLNQFISTGNPVTGLRFAFSTSRSLKGKLRYLVSVAFPPPESIARSYPVASKWQLPVAYVRRWIKIIFNR